MLAVGQVFVLAIIGSFVCGLLILSLLPVKEPSFCITDILFAGLIGLTVFAQYLSLYGGLMEESVLRLFVYALVILLILCLAGKRSRKRAMALVKSTFVTRLSFARVIIGGILFLCFVYGTTHGIEHYDTGLYHAQAIHWIAKAGYMKGLGNLHTRLAYNSASFALSALFSIHGTHAMAGFAALLLAWKCMDIGKGLRKKSVRETGSKSLVLSDAARLCACWYLFTIYDEMVSPAPDYFVTCAILYIVIAWLDACERHAGSDSYALLCVAAVYATTVKLSAAPLMLLTVYAVINLKKSNIVRYFLTGCATAAPFFIRNYYLSGYLIYPFPALDFFDVPWKIPKGVAAYDAKEIAVYGRGFTNVTRYDEPLRTWFPNWFSALSGMDKLLFLIDLLVPFLLVFFFLQLIKEHRRSGKLDVLRYGRLYLLLILDVQFLFWFCTAPLVRYGKVILMLPAVLAICWLLTDAEGRRVLKTKTEYAFALALLVLFFGYKSAMLIRDDLPRADVRWRKEQQPFATFALETYDEDFLYGRLMAPTEGDRVGEELLASPNRATLSPIGEFTLRLHGYLNHENGFQAAE